MSSPCEPILVPTTGARRSARASPEYLSTLTPLEYLVPFQACRLPQPHRPRATPAQGVSASDAPTKPATHSGVSMALGCWVRCSALDPSFSIIGSEMADRELAAQRVTRSLTQRARVCAHACVRACVCVCARPCECAFVRARSLCVRACLRALVPARTRHNVAPSTQAWQLRARRHGPYGSDGCALRGGAICA